MGPIVCPPNSQVEALTPRTSNVTVGVERAFKEVIKFKYNLTSVLI